MKRLHIHISVENLEKSHKFYTALFGMEPTKLKDDYIKFKIETIKTIDAQTEIIQNQVSVMAKMSEDHENAMSFFETGKRPKDPTQH